MKHDKLIEQLTASAQPVQVIRSPLKPTILTFILVALALSLSLAAFGPTVYWYHVESVWFKLELLGGGGAAFASLWLAINSALPGRKPEIFAFPLFLASLGIFMGSLAINSWSHHQSDFLVGIDHWQCVAPTVLLASLGAVLTRWAVLRLAPVNPRAVHFFSSTFVILLAGSLVTLCCPATGFVHLLLWHYSPVLLAWVLGNYSGRAMLRW
ncbi:NrsF family protein [Pseudobacteriovorax antillogorgiicola]|uniref:DUF1109 domain-containing protein n=1 Tax=Pseudobacteriovorax antillogorgiicola TaxID=1513793 RepID=A0A1Y6CNG0_9BACT|nr:NrsF family protein [Pseudobacteriovorax antillogorgiicola]TCS43644.1 hypothetical protein EDD56_13537 [Pseudobacteriovorax antillogorgiicola]SMF79939.1 hypothetical protein SAMN06296036_13416 [Pseudobacteriovorax antillogorgiicola]